MPSPTRSSATRAGPGLNAGWPYFDGTFRDYPAFKRKFESFQMNYHRGTPTRELFQQFREMCLPEKLSVKIKSADTIENAWIRLDAWFGDKGLFIKDLMQDIKSVTPIKEGNDERMMDAAGTHHGGPQRRRPGYAADPGQRGVDGAPAHRLGEEDLERGSGQVACRGQVLVHGRVCQRETAVCHQHGSHE
jgi:hypothetical protein